MGKSVFKNCLYKTILNVFNIAVPLVLGAYAIKILGKDKIGVYQYAESMYSIFYIFAAFGIYNYGLREISKVRDNKEKLKEVFSSLFILGLITNIISLTVFVIFILLNFKGTEKELILYLYCLTLFSNVFYVEWVNEALEKYDFITIKSIVVRLIYIFLLLKLVKTPKDLIIYIALYSFQVFLNNIISFVTIKREIGFTFKGIAFTKHIKFLIASTLIASASYLYTGLDRILIGKFLGDGHMPSYVVPQGIINMVFSLIMSIFTVTIPRLSYIIGNKDEKIYDEMLNKIIRCMCIFMFPAVVGLYVLHSEIILIYTSGQVVEGIPVMLIATLYMLSLGLESIVAQQVLYVKGKEKIIVCFIFFCGILNLLFKIILINLGKFSVLSAFSTTCLANYLLFFIQYMYARKVLKVNIRFLNIKTIKYLLISLIFIPIAMIIKRFISENMFFSIVTIITCCLYYGIVLLLIKDEVILAIIRKVKLT